MKKRIIYILLAIGFLLIGVIVYYYFKNDQLVYESFLGIHKSETGLKNEEALKRFNVAEKSDFVYSLTHNLANWLPDLCWEISFLYMLTAVWGSWKQVPTLLKIVTLLVIIGSEVLQRLGYLAGTGDIMDILVYFIGFTIFTLLYTKQRAKS
jgi:hypothetical protein